MGTLGHVTQDQENSPMTYREILKAKLELAIKRGDRAAILMLQARLYGEMPFRDIPDYRLMVAFR